MKYFNVPDPITLADPVNDGKPYRKMCPDSKQPTPLELRNGASPILIDEPPKSFWDWLKIYILRDKKCNQDYETFSRVSRVAELLKDAAPGDAIIMDLDDWKLLSGVITKPTSSPYPDALLASQFQKFMGVIMNASDEPPTVTAPVEAEALVEATG